MTAASGPGDPQVNLSPVIAEITDTFLRYEAALLANDVDALDGFMWHDPRTVRVGVDERQDGFAAISAFRRSQPRQSPPRRLTDTVIVAFDQRTAVVTTTFVPTDGSPDGRQSQTWVRFTDGWRIVAAHVSWAASAKLQTMDPQR